MKITIIRAVNLQGWTGEESLAPLTAMIGDNWSGKTTRVNAVILGLLGYIPSLGKTAKATFGLASGRQMEVELICDDGSKFSRQWRIEGNSIKTISSVPEWAKRSEDILVMIDAEAYFGLSDRDRTTYVFNYLPIPTDLQVPALSQMARSKMEVVGEATAIADGLIADLLGQEYASPQEFVGLAIDSCQSRAKRTRATIDEMQKTITGLSHLKAADAPSVAPNIEELTNKLTSARHALGLLGEQKGSFAQQHSAMTRAGNRRTEVERELRTFDAHRVLLSDERNRLTALGLELELLPPPIDSAELNALQMKHAKDQADLGTARTEYAEIGRKLTKAKTELAEIQHAEQCPYCGSAGIGWRTLRENELKDQIQTMTLRQHALTDEGHRLSAEVKTAADSLGLIDNQTKKRQMLVLQRDGSASAVRQLEQRLQRVDLLNQELTGLTPFDPKLEQQAQEVGTAISVANQTISTLERLRRDAETRQHELKRLAEAETERDRSKIEMEVYKQAELAYREVQESLVARAFEPLIERANGLFGRLMITPLALHEGEIGTWRDGIWAAHGGMSGGEKALIYASIQMALASMGPSRIAIMDELGRFSGKNLRLVITAAKDAVKAGHIDQWIGLDAVIERIGIYQEAVDSSFLLREL